jgi:hypothetical protein
VVYDANNFQECEVTAYNPATGSLSFAAPTRTVGSGTYSAWSVNLDGASGGDGSSGTSGTSATAGTSGSTGTSGSSGSSGSSGTSGSSGSAGTAGTSGRNGIDGSSGASIANWYGSFSDSTTQPITAANTPTAITYNTVEISNGIAISGSQIQYQHTGIYEIGYSLQIERTSGGSAVDVDIFLRLNGTDIIRTDSILAINSNNAKALPFVSNILQLNATDYLEILFASTSAAVQITAVPAQSVPYAHPAAPSIIVVTKQVGIAVGTTSGTSGSSGSSGSSGINGSSGNTGSSGSAGSSGSSGTSGVDGSTGSSGSAGSSGSSGSSGTTGTSGSSATSGTSGTSGSAGSSGSSGTTGTSGTSATSGSTGTSGSSGTSGNATTSARAVQTFTSTSGQTTFTVTNGYNLGMVDVFVNGVKFVNGTDFTATNGTTVVMAAGLAAGNIVEIDNLLTAYLPTNALRTITTFTATAAQTTFSVSYTQGLIDVFYNGSCLAQSEYTATNGTSIILATACQLNDIVVVYAYSYSVGAYSGIGGSGTINTIPKFTASSTIGDSAITDNGTTVTLVARALSGTSATFSSSLTSDTLLVNAAAQANVTALIQGKVATAGTALKVISDGNGTDKVFEFTGADGVAAQTMTMLQSGNVGIGTTSPLRNLVVKQSVNSYLGGLAVERSDNLSYLGIFNDGSLWNIAASYNSGGSYQPIGFYTSDLIRMTINTSGKVTIQNSIPGDITFFAQNTSSTGYGAAVQGGNGSGVYSFVVRKYDTTDYFQVRGDGYLQSPPTYNNTTASGANVSITSSGYFERSTSSIRFKTNVEDLTIDTSSILSKMRPIWYRSLGQNDKKEWSWYGFIAEEIAEIEPRLVQWGYDKTSYEIVEIKDEEGNIKKENKLKEDAVLIPDGVQYERITVLLVAEIQKMRKELNDLKAIIATK